MEKQVKTQMPLQYLNGWIQFPCNGFKSEMMFGSDVVTSIIFLN